MPRLRRLVEAEVGIGITVILAAASVTSQPPAVDLVNDTVPPQQVWSRIKPAWPRLGIEALAQSSPNAPAGRCASRSAPQPPPLSVEGTPLTPKNLADIEESELNHHWMGLARTRHGSSGASGSNRQGPMGRVLAAAAHWYRDLHHRARRHRGLASGTAGLLGNAVCDRKTFNIAWRRWCALGSRSSNCACASESWRTIRRPSSFP